MNKINNIEVLRIIGCLAIILCHLFNYDRLFLLFPDIKFYNTFWQTVQNGDKAVDLFFIISGFFFAYKLNMQESLKDFIYKKFIRFFPLMFFISICFTLAALLGIFKYKFYHLLINLLFLNGTPLVLTIGSPGILWFISALFWCLIFYFYLVKNYSKKNVDLILALLIFYSYGAIIHQFNGKLGFHDATVFNFLNAGILRALGGIGIGYFISKWYKSNFEFIQNLSTNIIQCCIYTIAEVFCLFFIIDKLIFHKMLYKNQLIYIIIFAITIILFLLKQGYISKFFDSNICSKLSKYTFSIYITHTFIFALIKELFWKIKPEIIYAHPIGNVVIALVLVLIFGIFTYHFIEKPCATYLYNKFGKK